MKYLIIVESPSKCKKIEKYLNDNDRFNIYEVVATIGQITELKCLENIDISNNFLCKYELIQSKKKNTEFIRKRIAAVDEVFLFLDNDREGEGIAYMVCQTFGLNVDLVKRFVFNEITEAAIVKSLQSPRHIDINLVNSQQTRQILDMLVGFKITPILWNQLKLEKVEEKPWSKFDKKNIVSVGRCQIPALKLLYENELDMNNKETNNVYYGITGYFTGKNIPFTLNQHFSSNRENELVQYLSKCVHYSNNFIYTCSKPKISYRNPREPLTTSTLQQEASNLLHYSPKETMKLAQTLYEEGFITYMRTDNRKYSKEFIDSARSLIGLTYEVTFISDTIDMLQIDVDTSAHEAIRPTNILLKELSEERKDGKDEKDEKERKTQKACEKLYKLIWEHSMESCMAPARVLTITASITAPDNYEFQHSSELVVFPGWLKVKNTITYSSEQEKIYNYLLYLKKGDKVQYNKFLSSHHLENSGKLHYSEARLVQLLEEKGIGRPSTFASIVEKLKEREYVKVQDIKGTLVEYKEYEVNENGILIVTMREKIVGNEKKKLVIQPLGTKVIEFANTHFANVFHYDFTRDMETDLDKIAKSEINWTTICEKCNTQIEENIANMTNNEKTKSITHPVKYAPLGKYKNLNIMVKKGKYGLYAVWNSTNISLKQLGNRPRENIQLEEVIRIIESKLGE